MNQFFDGSVSEPIPHRLGPMRDRGSVGYCHLADQNAGTSKPGLYFTLVMVVRLATGNSTHPRTHSPSTMGSLLKGYWGVGNPLYLLSLEMYWPFWASDTDQSLQPTVKLLA